eukprot:jgi/Botrbrau1/14806/Bobra.0370s0003.2
MSTIRSQKRSFGILPVTLTTLFLCLVCCIGTSTPKGQGINAESRQYLDSGSDTAALQEILTKFNVTAEGREASKGTVCVGDYGDLPGWPGIVACRAGHVVNLTLTGFVEGGGLPANIHRLSRLEVLACDSCSLTGTLPPAWALLNKTLTTVQLYGNQISGTLPDEYAVLQNLATFNVSGNLLSGTLPETWRLLNRTLRLLDVGDNRLTGTLPEGWRRLGMMDALFLNSNGLQGTLPSSWSEIGAASALRYLSLYDNHFTGELPAAWGTLGNLWRLYLDSNALTGTLPKAWGALDSLHELTLTNNNISGTLPGSSWSLGMRSMIKLNLRNNSISGTLPAEWIGPSDVWPMVQYIDLRYNDLVGPFPQVAPGPNFRIELRRGEDRDPHLFLEPMKYGFGLCGTAPQEGPLISAPVADSLRYGELVTRLERFVMDCEAPRAGPSPILLPLGLGIGAACLVGVLALAGWRTGFCRTAVQPSGTTKAPPPALSPVQPAPSVRQSSGGSPRHARRSRRERSSRSRPSRANTGEIRPAPSLAAEHSPRGRSRVDRKPSSTVTPSEASAGSHRAPSGEETLARERERQDGVPDGRSGSPPAFPLGPRLGETAGSAGDTDPQESGDPLLTPGESSPPKSTEMALQVPERRKMKRGSPLWGSTTDGSGGTPISGQAKARRYSKSPSGGLRSLHRLWLRSPFAAASTNDNASGSPTVETSNPFSHTSGSLGTWPSSPQKMEGMPSSSLTAAGSAIFDRLIRESDIVFSMNAKGQLVSLGAGTYGRVYRGVWHGTEVAIKVLKDELEEGPTQPLWTGDGMSPEDVQLAVLAHKQKRRELFFKEADLLEQLRHPNIVNFLGFCQESDKLMVVTELCPGGDLGKALRRNRNSGAFSWSRRGYQIALDVAAGLAYLHSLQVVHYDIKPGNILLDKSGSRAKISDVGMSRSMEHSTLHSSSVRGTLDYMAPEQIMHLRATTASDIFSYGIVLWQLITGEEPNRRNGPLREPTYASSAS